MRRRGFTLIEIIIVVAIFSVLISLGLFMSMETLRGTLNRSERDIVVSALQKARSRALANMQQAPWGVCYIAPDYIVFRGFECAPGLPTNETVPANTANSIVFPSPIVFSQLSATTTGGSITIAQDGRTATITVNQEGMIDW
ncbi:TPA: hypothetical protein DIV48_02485 [Candidatus Kaiserbacteria bacterium]|nr:MAG: hypothetical protein UY93_C0002G0142 [Parcubacteria group bacterium GW2011_GWA1_56_13]KKW46805.1 MAG: hypothetical protein UY97_C0003G0079 [Parcubacteria group bacterium GW2011_GWB1_57_6]HCR52495.1 hypothetical protein [Candidatus Kaiserbacteria bacterium]